MKLPLNWLREFVKFKETPEKLAELLTLSGSEVERIERGVRMDPKIVVGEVKTVIQHPTADRLKVTKVDVGSSSQLSIVCGATNVKPGMKAACALPGVKLATGERLERATIRGVESEGMLLAEDELGFGPDHTGIVSLDSDAKVGEPVGKWLGSNDVTLELEITPNRADCLSVIGLAREVAALTKRELDVKRYELTEVAPEAKTKLTVKANDAKSCPKYIARVVRGVKVSPSPQWMQSRLRSVGIRPINNVVDATNYVMFELGQPLHAFDAAKVGKRIVVRRARRGEKLTTLDEVQRKLESADIVITDGKKPIAIAGVMGGRESEVSERTHEVILESAIFDPISIRRTARRFNLRSEASSRFERGIDWALSEKAVNRAAALLQLIASGKVLKGQVSAVTGKPYLRPVVSTTAEAINSLLGTKLEAKAMVELLERLHIPVSVIVGQALTALERKKVEEKLVESSRKLLGRTYERGGKQKGSFDCSSFIQYVFRQVSIVLPRTTVEQFNVGKALKARSFQVGDLLFTKGDRPHYSTLAPNGVGHVGMYVGNGKVIQAKDGVGVVEVPVRAFTTKDYRGARRILGVEMPETILVVPPTSRRDLSIPADIAEEVGRLYGYNEMKPTLLTGILQPHKTDAPHDLRESLRDTLIALGCTETFSYSFYGERIAQEFHLEPGHHFTVTNPFNPDQALLRSSLIPNLIHQVEANLAEQDAVLFFEIGRVFQSLPRSSTELILRGERQKLAVAAWTRLGKAYELLHQALLRTLGIVGIEEDEMTTKKFGLQAEQVFVRGHELGERRWVTVKQAAPIHVFELDVDLLVGFIRASRPAFKRFPDLPPVRRDLAVAVPVDTRYADLRRTILAVDSLVEFVEGFERFPLPDGKVSYAFHITYRSAKRTLTGEEVNRIHDRITKRLVEKFHATPR